MKLPLLLTVILIVFQSPNLTAQSVSVSHYSMSIEFKLHENQLHNKTTLTFVNKGETAINEIPLILYRLLRITNVAESNGTTVKFK